MSEQNICIDSFVPTATDRKPGLTVRIQGRWARILADFRAWQEQRNTYQLLRRLNDRQLRDIGIRRHDLPPTLQNHLVGDQPSMTALFPQAFLTLTETSKRKVCD